MLRRWLLYVASVLLGLSLVGGLLGAFVLALLYPTLPSLESLTDYHPKIPLRVVSAEGDILGEFGEERRAVVAIRDVPDVMINAILAAEDERFYSHGGVDYISVMRAAATNLASGTQQGAGTITMQVARNFFLTREKTITRKLREVLLAWKIEANLSKDEILELYVNQIFLGQRAYGFAAASQIYFGKALRDLTPAEAAMLAGLPKAPSAYNPVSNPKRAKSRQLYVLRRMHDLKYISSEQFRDAQTAPLAVRQGLREALPTHAEFVAEMARQVVFDAYGEDAYTKGLTVQTTIRKADQEAAYAAVRRGVIDYDHRHGYRGPEAYLRLPEDAAERDAALEHLFAETSDGDGLVPAVVTDASATEVKAVLADGEVAEITGDGLKFAARALTDKAPATSRIRPGAVIRLARDAKGRWEITQLPQAESAFVSRAAAGRRHPVARRRLELRAQQVQPRDAGAAPARLGVQAVHLLGGAGKGIHAGDHRQRRPVLRSRRADRQRGLGAQELRRQVRRADAHPRRARQVQEPRHRSRAAGDRAAVRAGLHHPLRLRPEAPPAVPDDGPRRGLGDADADGDGLFGLRQRRIPDRALSHQPDHRRQGQRALRGHPVEAGGTAERAIDPRNAWIMTSLLKDVVRVGTATRALSLNRNDLAGKTGTTNENVDAWFCGYNGDMVAVAWIGFDQPRTLGANETGAVAALPIWISYMAKALKGAPEANRPMPEGILALTINAETGLRDDVGGITEYFLAEFPPRRRDDSFVPGKSGKDIRDQLF